MSSLRSETPAKGIAMGTARSAVAGSEPLIDRPTLGQVLRFTRLNVEDSEERKKAIEIHNAAWRNEALMRKQGFTDAEIERSKALEINEDELRMRFSLFPEGQIVGRNGEGIMASMLNTRLIFIKSSDEIRPGYKRISSEPIEPDVRETSGIAGLLKDHVGILICFSIVTDPQFQRQDFALITLAHGIEIAAQLGLAAIPFSVPRGFGAYRKKFREVEIMTYLHITKPPIDENQILAYQRYIRKIELLNRSDTSKVYLKPLEPLSFEDFIREAYVPEGLITYIDFKGRCGAGFSAKYGKEPTVVDYIRISGRQHVDPVMNMHIQFGADFIYKDGRITCVFANSRPEDVMAGGYNIALTYHHRDIFVD